MTIGSIASWTFRTDRLTAFADRLLDTVVSTFETAGVELPERRFMTVGEPVHDCAQLALTFQEVERGLPGTTGEPAVCDGPLTATFQVHLVRPFPVPQGRNSSAPPAESLTANAEGLMVDAWLLMEAANIINGDVRNVIPGMISSVAVGEPQGGFVGVVLTVIAAVP